MTAEDQGTSGAREGATDWPALLEEYRRLAQADWNASRRYEDASHDKPRPENLPALERSAKETDRQLEAIIQTISDTEADRLEALAVKLAVHWSRVIDHGSEPFAYDELLIRSAIDFLSIRTGLDLFVEYSREGKWLLTRYDERERRAS